MITIGYMVHTDYQSEGQAMGKQGWACVSGRLRATTPPSITIKATKIVNQMVDTQPSKLRCKPWQDN